MVLTSNNPEPKLELQTVKMEEELEAATLIDEALVVLNLAKTDLADGMVQDAYERMEQLGRKRERIEKLLDAVLWNTPED